MVNGYNWWLIAVQAGHHCFHHLHHCLWVFIYNLCYFNHFNFHHQISCLPMSSFFSLTVCIMFMQDYEIFIIRSTALPFRLFLTVLTIFHIFVGNMFNLRHGRRPHPGPRDGRDMSWSFSLDLIIVITSSIRTARITIILILILILIEVYHVRAVIDAKYRSTRWLTGVWVMIVTLSLGVGCVHEVCPSGSEWTERGCLIPYCDLAGAWTLTSNLLGCQTVCRWCVDQQTWSLIPNCSMAHSGT